jgi:hypothetical protein
MAKLVKLSRADRRKMDKLVASDPRLDKWDEDDSSYDDEFDRTDIWVYFVPGVKDIWRDVHHLHLFCVEDVIEALKGNRVGPCNLECDCDHAEAARGATR